MQVVSWTPLKTFELDKYLNYILGKYINLHVTADVQFQTVVTLRVGRKLVGWSLVSI